MWILRMKNLVTFLSVSTDYVDQFYLQWYDELWLDAKKRNVDDNDNVNAGIIKKIWDVLNILWQHEIYSFFYIHLILIFIPWRKKKQQNELLMRKVFHHRIYFFFFFFFHPHCIHISNHFTVLVLALSWLKWNGVRWRDRVKEWKSFSI